MKVFIKAAYFWLIPWGMGLVGLGVFSGYSPYPPAGSYTDARVASMLAPSGIIESVLLNHTPDGAIDLRPYYSKPLERGGFFENPWLSFAYAWVVIGAIGYWVAGRPFR